MIWPACIVLLSKCKVIAIFLNLFSILYIEVWTEVFKVSRYCWLPISLAGFIVCHHACVCLCMCLVHRYIYVYNCSVGHHQVILWGSSLLGEKQWFCGKCGVACGAVGWSVEWRGAVCEMVFHKHRIMRHITHHITSHTTSHHTPLYTRTAARCKSFHTHPNPVTQPPSKTDDLLI